MTRRAWLAAACLATVLTVFLIAWVLSMHGSVGLYRASWIMPAVFGVLLAVGAAAPFLVLLESRRPGPSGKKWRPAVPVMVVVAVALVVPAVALAYLVSPNGARRRQTADPVCRTDTVCRAGRPGGIRSGFGRSLRNVSQPERPYSRHA